MENIGCLCEYGCGQKAYFRFNNGRYCCSKNISQCSAIRKKNSGNNNPMFGRYHNEESRKKISQRHIGKRMLSFEEVKKIVKNENYEFLSTEEEYRTSFAKVSFKCPKGHKFKMLWDSFKIGHRCPKCAIKIIAQKTKERMLNGQADSMSNINRGRRIMSFKDFKKFVEDKGYELLSNEKEYRTNSKIKFKCPKGHEFEMRWDSFKRGDKCPKCRYIKCKEYMLNGGAAYTNSFIKNPSQPQVNLFELTKSIYSTSILNYPILNYSIDIAIPNLKIAIEYDGSYWHQNQEADNKRQEQIENKGWVFLRYRDYVPSLEDLSLDIFFKIQDLIERRNNMIILKENETCPFSSKCQYANDCQGTNPQRNNVFTCTHVSNDGIIKEGQFRNLYDQTGKMQILSEENNYG